MDPFKIPAVPENVVKSVEDLKKSSKRMNSTEEENIIPNHGPMTDLKTSIAEGNVTLLKSNQIQGGQPLRNITTISNCQGRPHVMILPNKSILPSQLPTVPSVARPTPTDTSGGTGQPDSSPLVFPVLRKLALPMTPVETCPSSTVTSSAIGQPIMSSIVLPATQNVPAVLKLTLPSAESKAHPAGSSTVCSSGTGQPVTTSMVLPVLRELTLTMASSKTGPGTSSGTRQPVTSSMKLPALPKLTLPSGISVTRLKSSSATGQPASTSLLLPVKQRGSLSVAPSNPPWEPGTSSLDLPVVPKLTLPSGISMRRPKSSSTTGQPASTSLLLPITQRGSVSVAPSNPPWEPGTSSLDLPVVPKLTLPSGISMRRPKSSSDTGQAASSSLLLPVKQNGTLPISPPIGPIRKLVPSSKKTFRIVPIKRKATAPLKEPSRPECSLPMLTESVLSTVTSMTPLTSTVMTCPPLIYTVVPISEPVVILSGILPLQSIVFPPPPAAPPITNLVGESVLNESTTNSPGEYPTQTKEQKFSFCKIDVMLSSNYSSEYIPDLCKGATTRKLVSPFENDSCLM